jgi:hypothetical protein
LTTSGRRLDYQIRYGHSLGEYGKAPFIKGFGGWKGSVRFTMALKKESRESWQTVGVRVRLFLGQVRLVGFFSFFSQRMNGGGLVGMLGEGS